MSKPSAHGAEAQDLHAAGTWKQETSHWQRDVAISSICSQDPSSYLVCITVGLRAGHFPSLGLGSSSVK